MAMYNGGQPSTQSENPVNPDSDNKYSRSIREICKIRQIRDSDEYAKKEVS